MRPGAALSAWGIGFHIPVLGAKNGGTSRLSPGFRRTPDPAILLGNRYAYVMDNPVNYIDPSGLNHCSPGRVAQVSPAAAILRVPGWWPRLVAQVRVLPLDANLGYVRNIVAPRARGVAVE